ncbi:MAG: hypothetical protein GX774_04090 [Armatimonadetes bacterium]|jgi:hypothetical protein|nr:hypothetical protein [Armatimonadota bacterium]
MAETQEPQAGAAAPAQEPQAAAPAPEAKPHPGALQDAEVVTEMEIGRTSKLVFQIGKRRSGDQAFDIREYVDRPPRGDNPGYSGPTRSGFRLHEENYEEFLEAVKAVGRKLGYVVD